MVTLVGLGPGSPDSLSAAARSVLRAAASLYLRTERHPCVASLRAEGIRFDTFDAEYEAAPSFEILYERIASLIIERAKTEDLVYAVPGHPLIGEETCRLVLERARQENIPVRIAGSESFVEAALTALGRPLGDGLFIADALSTGETSWPDWTDLLVYQVYDSETASRVKLRLLETHPEETLVHIVQAAGVPGEEAVLEIPLVRLDRAPTDHLTAVFVPALPIEKRRPSFQTLAAIMARLRSAGGCPWDREQNHETLRRYLIEECYEAIDAIDAGDPQALCEEMGDILLQVVFHAQLGSEAGSFDVRDVIESIVGKLIRRHPHVFGTANAEDSDEVLRNWERIKREEKGRDAESRLDGVPKHLPSLMRAMEISRKAVKAGFEWNRFEDVLAKLDEETEELKEALDADKTGRIAHELGDLLFAAVQVARWKQIDPEEALRTMLARFETRFRAMERASSDQGRQLEEMSLAEQDALWKAAKTAEQST